MILLLLLALASGEIAYAQTTLPAAADPLRRNNLAWARGKYYAPPAASYQAATWSVSLEVPVSYWNFTIADAPLAQAQRLRTATVELRLRVRHDLVALWYLSGGADLTNRFGDITQLNYAYLLRDYRTLQRSPAGPQPGLERPRGAALQKSAHLVVLPRHLPLLAYRE